MRTLSGIQKIAAASCVSSDAADAASRSRSRLSRSTEYTAGSFFVTRMLEHASSDASSAAFREETSSYITSVMKVRIGQNRPAPLPIPTPALTRATRSFVRAGPSGGVVVSLHEWERHASVPGAG